MSYVKSANPDCSCGRWTMFTVTRGWFGKPFSAGPLRFFVYKLVGTYRFNSAPIKAFDYTFTTGKTDADWGRETVADIGPDLLPYLSISDLLPMPASNVNQTLSQVGAWVWNHDMTSVPYTWTLASFTPGASYSITVSHFRTGYFAFAESWTDENSFTYMKAMCDADFAMMRTGNFSPSGSGSSSRIVNYDRSFQGVPVPAEEVGIFSVAAGSSMVLRRTTIWECGNHSLKTWVAINSATTNCVNFHICGGEGCDSDRKEVEPPTITAAQYGPPFPAQHTFLERKAVVYFNQSCPP